MPSYPNRYRGLGITALAVALFAISFAIQNTILTLMFNSVDADVQAEHSFTQFLTGISISAIIGLLPFLCSLVLGMKRSYKRWWLILFISVLACIAIAYFAVFVRIFYLNNTLLSENNTGYASMISIEAIRIPAYFALGTIIGVVSFALCKKYLSHSL